MHRILLIMPYGSVGGMERLAKTFYELYRSQGHCVKAVKIIGLRNDIVNFGADEIVFSQKDFCDYSIVTRSLLYLSMPLKLRRIIKQEHITHSISFGDMANMVSSFTGTSEFKIASIHALKSVELLNKTFLNRVFRWGYKNSYKNFDKVVCISEAIRKDMLDNLAYKFHKNLQVIYNPHDIGTIQEMASEQLTTEDMKLMSGKVILFVGRLSLQKAPWHLIKAFSIIKKEKNDVRLVFVGDGSSAIQDYLAKLTVLLGIERSVFFLGRRSNPYAFMSHASCLALSSYYEGTPNVIVEAMILQTPVVSSNCTDGILELMDPVSKPENGIIRCRGGLVTPTFFKGKVEIPKDDSITSDEEVFAKALVLALDMKYKMQVQGEEIESYLQKFATEKVGSDYLRPLGQVDNS